ncbi:SDR family NAD(P)-dependent oxidoreductase, partial [Nocardia vinacea]|uniref:SDR family NAD(P)-dependent oxidoreductase n=1 Tax=Nocardia vinacea TaxID=96468 RepID=UPI001C3F40A7
MSAAPHITAPAETYRPVPLLQDKVLVIAGVGPGLGHSLSIEAARMGANLVLVSRTEHKLDKIAEQVREHGGTALVAPADITIEEQRQSLVDRALAEYGRIDCL